MTAQGGGQVPVQVDGRQTSVSNQVLGYEIPRSHSNAVYSFDDVDGRWIDHVTWPRWESWSP